MMEIHNTMEEVPSSMIREVSCLMELNHPNIIRLMLVVSQGLCLFLEYQANDLAYLLKYPKDSMDGYSIKFSSSDSLRCCLLSFGKTVKVADLQALDWPSH
ncbi:hypothetical protein CISIN_1g034245mg [Citrus sinensis]|uniref:Protein kinase domain-containing protein n=1 Tax=Citrus sinensis TaxID=2711 RepID=A0A067CZG1_CITSI|nr:hypothetical protein CISIN_1g034245mg [Citrus sinensis]